MSSGEVKVALKGNSNCWAPLSDVQLPAKAEPQNARGRRKAVMQVSRLGRRGSGDLILIITLRV
ncbi:hypothetical protein D9M68_982990 [compost metagenome]